MSLNVSVLALVFHPLAVCALVCPGWLVSPASAQAPLLRDGPIIEPKPAAPQPLAAALTEQSVVQVFLEGCVLHEGQSGAVTDWALAQGFESLDPLRTGAEDLLGGAAGTVLAVPGSAGRVLLAAGEDRRCLVWAEQTSGPKLRSAFQKLVSSLGFKGARVQSVIDRNLNNGGAWRNQSLWRYRRVGGDQDFGLGSATTLAHAPGAQLLHFAPMAGVAPRQPDGMPSR